MNTNPDDMRLTLWLEDELEAQEQADFEGQKTLCPEHLAAREEVRRWKWMISSALPPTEEPPHAEFFQARIARAIREVPQRELASDSSASVIAGPRAWFAPRRWFLPFASCAGMALAFWLGTRQVGNHSPQFAAIDVTGAPRAIPVDPALYTPDSSVSAEYFSSHGASASVIVLSGVRSIPDEKDFSKTADSGQIREIDLTAGLEP